MLLEKEASRKTEGGDKDNKGYSNMLGMSKSTAYNSTSSIKSVTSSGIRANAFEVNKYPTKV